MSTNAEVGENQRRTGVWVAVGLLLLVFGFTMALTLPAYVERSNPFWFIGMLVIFGAALSLIAVVFRWLGMARADEAFALPAGSVRTMLAVGVMVLFAVFGLEAVSTAPGSFSPRLSEQPIGNAFASATPAALEAEIRRYERQGLAAVVTASDADRATLQLYRLEPVRPAATVDMQKQVLTALITLLTSVVSFYFGSRSAEAAADHQRRDAAAGSPAGAKAPDGPPPTDTTSTDVDSLDKELAEQQRRLAALQDETPEAGQEAEFAAALAPLASQVHALRAEREALNMLIESVRAGSRPSSELTPALQSLQQRVTQLSTQLGELESRVAKG